MIQEDIEMFQTQSRCIAHEIRNQVSICELYSDIIKKHLEKSSYENPAVENALNCIKKSAQIIGTSLLDLKSLNTLEIKKHDIRTILEEGVRLSKVYICDKDIKITQDINNSAIVEVDGNKFLACIVNIIKNGIEAIEETGQMNISLNIQNSFAHIKISNNGMPIAPEKQKEIFGEGYTTKQKGSGLGLFICKNNLNLQNADLRLNRSDNEITEFEIIIPVKKETV